MTTTYLPILALLVGCGGTDPVTPPDAAPEPPPDSLPDAPAECNTLVLPDQGVDEVRVAEDRPAPAGGTLVPGSYLLTSAVIYTGVGGATGPTGKTFRASTVNDGAHYDYLEHDVLGANKSTTRMSGTYSTAGAMATINNECPGGAPSQFGLTATPSSFTLFGGNNALEFTRQ